MGSLKSKKTMSKAKSQSTTGRPSSRKSMREERATNRANINSFLDQGYSLYESINKGMRKGGLDKIAAYRARVGGAAPTTGYQQPGMQGSALAKIVKANKAKAKKHLK